VRDENWKYVCQDCKVQPRMPGSKVCGVCWLDSLRRLRVLAWREIEGASTKGHYDKWSGMEPDEAERQYIGGNR
jgi:hypothetical protein